MAKQILVGIREQNLNEIAHYLMIWKQEYGNLYLQAKVCDSGTYFLLDKDKKVICKISQSFPIL